MVYAAEIKKREKQSRRERLVKLWCECESLPEFWVKQAVEVPDATWHERTCFKLHSFKREHPALWCVFCDAAFIGLLAIAVASIVGFCKTIYCAFLASGTLSIAAMQFCFKFFDFMAYIERTENRCIV